MRKFKVGDVIQWKDEFPVFKDYRGMKGIIEGIVYDQLLKYTVRVLEGTEKGEVLQVSGKNFVDQSQMNRNGANSKKLRESEVKK